MVKISKKQDRTYSTELHSLFAKHIFNFRFRYFQLPVSEKQPTSGFEVPTGGRKVPHAIDQVKLYTPQKFHANRFTRLGGDRFTIIKKPHLSDFQIKCTCINVQNSTVKQVFLASGSLIYTFDSMKTTYTIVNFVHIAMRKTSTTFHIWKIIFEYRITNVISVERNLIHLAISICTAKSTKELFIIAWFAKNMKRKRQTPWLNIWKIDIEKFWESQHNGKILNNLQKQNDCFKN